MNEVFCVIKKTNSSSSSSVCSYIVSNENIVMKTMTLDIVLSQDQNPPTTGKTTQNTTSTFGPNLPTTSAGNITSGVARNMTK